MLDFSSIFFFGLSLRPKIRARGLMRKSLFFLPFFCLFFLGRTGLPKFPRARKKQEGALKNHPKGQKKEERGGEEKKKNESSLCTPSLSSLSLSLSLSGSAQRYTQLTDCDRLTDRAIFSSLSREITTDANDEKIEGSNRRHRQGGRQG